ncbi:MAG TPA: hypothetical protein DCX53_04725, partial [Anaerolineae bacterium]|nr:hypothetical protein [Anaerolineae bacterium]
MILDAATLRDILGIIGFGTFICLLPLLVVIGLIYSTVVKIRQGTAHQKLGQALGFSPVTRSTDIKNTPYSGLYKGRAVAIRTFSSAYTYYMDGRSRRGFNIKLRIVAEVRLAHLLRTKVYNRESWKTAQN